jgi:hypothetical protein
LPIFSSINTTLLLLFWILPWALGFLLFGGVFSRLKDYYIKESFGGCVMGLPLEFRRKDRWIPSFSSHLVLSPVGGLGQEVTVSDLIDRERGCWNSNIIFENFLKEEAEAILNIPLSPNLPQDKIIWIGSKSGMFSIKSAYHI